MANRLHGLDILRLLMALSVLFFHFAFRGPAGGDMPALDLPAWLVASSHYGYLGVSVFFMISGFVIAFSAEGRTPQEFAIARFARLYPTFILVMTITYVLMSTGLYPNVHVSFMDYLANFIISARAIGHPFMDGAYWSIVVEVLFYGWVFALMLLGLFQTRKLPILIVWLVISALNNFILHSSALDKMLITSFSGFFIAGIAIYELRKRQSAGFWLVLVAAIGEAVLASVHAKLAVEAELHSPLSSTVIALVILASPFVFWGFLSLRLSGRWVTLAGILGGITYPLYLLHQNVGYLIFFQLGHGNSVTLALVMSGLVLAAFLIYMLFDRHMVRLTRTTLTRALARVSKQKRTISSKSSSGMPANGKPTTSF